MEELLQLPRKNKAWEAEIVEDGSFNKLLCKLLRTIINGSLLIRVFHKNTLLKEKVVHTLTTPYRAYINHTQKISFLGQV